MKFRSEQRKKHNLLKKLAKFPDRNIQVANKGGGVVEMSVTLDDGKTGVVCSTFKGKELVTLRDLINRALQGDPNYVVAHKPVRLAEPAAEDQGEGGSDE